MRAGDIVTVDFGIPQGSEPGFARPAVIVTADLVLQSSPRTLHVVPLTSNVTRRLPTEVELGEVDLPLRSAAQAHLCGVTSGALHRTWVTPRSHKFDRLSPTSSIAHETEQRVDLIT